MGSKLVSKGVEGAEAKEASNYSLMLKVSVRNLRFRKFVFSGTLPAGFEPGTFGLSASS